MTPFYLIQDGAIVPYSVAQFRADHPSLSVSDDPHAGELASYASLDPPLIVIRPVPTEPPPHDPNSQWVQESLPAWSDGAWRQAWTVHDLPPPEPVSDWAGFGAWLGDEPAAAEAIATARLSVSPQGEPATSWYLPQAIMTARLGNITEFAMAWTRFRQASHMSPEVLAAIVAKAAEFNLPAEFIAALQPQSPPG